jgi:hypothetical protein
MKKSFLVTLVTFITLFLIHSNYSSGLDQSVGVNLSSDYYGQWPNGFPSDPNFFLLAVWLQSPSNAQEFKNIGINTYVGLWEGPTEEQLSSLKSQSVFVVASQNATALNSMSKDIIKSWMHQDEPDNAQWNEMTQSYDPCIAPSVLVDLYNAWKANDDTRPILLNFGQGVANIGWYGRGYLNNIGGKDYSVESGNYSLYYTEASAGADIVSFDIYPVTDTDANVSGKLEFVSQGVKNLINWTGGNKMVWNCIETTHINNASTRPTPDQIKSEVWMSLISGSMGIIYFVHEWEPSFREDGIFRYSDAVEAVEVINEQITSLAPVLNSPTIQNGAQVSSSEPIDLMVKHYNGEVYLFAVGLTNHSTAATFSVSGIVNGIVDVLGEDRQIAISSEQFQDNFSGYGVHLYKIYASDLPLTPTRLQATAVSFSRINLTWTDNSNNETGFKMERAPDTGGTPGTFVEIATVNANVTSYSDTGLSPETTYYYRVRAYNSEGDSNYSNSAQATTQEIRLTLISPNGGEVIVPGAGVLVQWDAPQDVVKFRLFYSLNNGRIWSPITKGFISGTSTTWNVPVLTKNATKCLVKIVGYNASNKKIGKDQSDGNFIIEVMNVLTPNGGETCTSGQPCPVIWETNVTVSTIRLSYSINNGETWKLLPDVILGDQTSYDWIPPTVKKTLITCKVKVVLKDEDGKVVGRDVSDGTFTIMP